MSDVPCQVRDIVGRFFEKGNEALYNFIEANRDQLPAEMPDFPRWVFGCMNSVCLC